MSILWAINHSKRLVEATARDVLRLTDVEDFLQGVALATTQSYRKLFDATQCTIELDKEDLLAIAGRVHVNSSRTQMGPVAIVVNSDATYEQARVFERMTASERPLKIFWHLAEAQEWLDANHRGTPLHEAFGDVPPLQ